MVAGVVLLAAANHLVMALSGKLHRGDGFFSLACFFLMPYTLMNPILYSAVNVTEYLAAVRVQMFCVAISMTAFLWFCAAFTKWKPKIFLWTISIGLFATVMPRVFSKDLLIYSNIRGMKTVILPWGESIQALDCDAGPLVWVYFPLILLIFGFGILAGIRQYRHGQRWHGMSMAIGISGFLILVLNDIAVDLFNLDWFYVAEFGFAFLVGFFSLILSRDLWISEKLKRQLGEAELLLIRAQRLEAMGSLAGGLAHDFNNILNAILGSKDLIQNLLKKDKGPLPNHEIDSYLDLIDHSVMQASGLIRQLLSLGKKQDFEWKALDANLLIQDSLKLCHGLIPHVVKVQLQPFPRTVLIRGEKLMVEQVLINLCVNACHAMTTMRPVDQIQGGTLNIRVLMETRKLPTASSPHDFSVIEVQDSGVGMSKETLDQLFQPFFTTKKEHGIGLGLSTAFIIMKQLEGFLEVRSEPGKGSTFRAGFVLETSPMNALV